MNGRHVFIVDDDPAVRDALVTLVESVGLKARCYPSADAFLADYTADLPGCLITDICLPGTDGMRLQQALAERDIRIPLIAMSAHGDIPMAVEIVRRGAIDFIEKPFRNHVMLSRIHEALERDAQQRRERLMQSELHERLRSLTPRERQVLPLLVDGLSNKRIAARLQLSPRTIESHRASILRKMQADSATALARQLSDRLPPR